MRLSQGVVPGLFSQNLLRKEKSKLVQDLTQKATAVPKIDASSVTGECIALSGVLCNMAILPLMLNAGHVVPITRTATKALAMPYTGSSVPEMGNGTTPIWPSRVPAPVLMFQKWGMVPYYMRGTSSFA